jgi:folate-binding protein YgfZ
LKALKHSTGLGDWTGWGVLRLAGSSRLDFVHRLSTNDVLGLEPGQGLATVFTTPIGRIVDLVFAIVRENDLLLIVSRGADSTVADWLQRHIFFNDDVVVEIMTGHWGLIGCSGPRAPSLVTVSVGSEVADLAPFHSITGQVNGKAVTVLRSIPLGNGFLLMTRADRAPDVWSSLAAAVTTVGGTLAGELALDTARLGAGWPRFGQELSEDYVPLETGLKWAISFEKGCYVGQEIIARMDTFQRLAKRIVVLGCDHAQNTEETAIMAGSTVWNRDRKVGQVTSVAPLIDQGIIKALAYVKIDSARPGEKLTVGEPMGGLTTTVLMVPGEGADSRETADRVSTSWRKM